MCRMYSLAEWASCEEARGSPQLLGGGGEWPEAQHRRALHGLGSPALTAGGHSLLEEVIP